MNAFDDKAGVFENGLLLISTYTGRGGQGIETEIVGDISFFTDFEVRNRFCSSWSSEVISSLRFLTLTVALGNENGGKNADFAFGLEKDKSDSRKDGDEPGVVDDESIPFLLGVMTKTWDLTGDEKASSALGVFEFVIVAISTKDEIPLSALGELLGAFSLNKIDFGVEYDPSEPSSLKGPYFFFKDAKGSKAGREPT